MKLRIDKGNNLAQMFLELLGTRFLLTCFIPSYDWYSAAAEVNNTVNYTDSSLPIYGLLTDYEKFEFYSYDPVAREFRVGEQIKVSWRREQRLSEMEAGTFFILCKSLRAHALPSVTNKIFSIVMTGFVEGLYACAEKSRTRAKEGDVSSSSHCDYGVVELFTSSAD
jgi:hypothetical protein